MNIHDPWKFPITVIRRTIRDSVRTSGKLEAIVDVAFSNMMLWNYEIMLIREYSFDEQGKR